MVVNHVPYKTKFCLFRCCVRDLSCSRRIDGEHKTFWVPDYSERGNKKAWLAKVPPALLMPRSSLYVSPLPACSTGRQWQGQPWCAPLHIFPEQCQAQPKSNIEWEQGIRSLLTAKWAAGDQVDWYGTQAMNGVTQSTTERAGKFRPRHNNSKTIPGKPTTLLPCRNLELEDRGPVGRSSV